MISKCINGARSVVSNIKGKYLAAGVAVGAPAMAFAQGAPTTMDGVSDLGAGYINKGTATAIAAAILGFGWVGYRIVKKFTKGATST